MSVSSINYLRPANYTSRIARTIKINDINGVHNHVLGYAKYDNFEVVDYGDNLLYPVNSTYYTYFNDLYFGCGRNNAANHWYSRSGTYNSSIIYCIRRSSDQYDLVINKDFTSLGVFVFNNYPYINGVSTFLDSTYTLTFANVALMDTGNNFLSMTFIIKVIKDGVEYTGLSYHSNTSHLIVYNTDLYQHPLYLGNTNNAGLSLAELCISQLTIYESPVVIDYTITVTQTEYGTVTVDKTEAAENDTVRVTLKPNLGQKLYRLLVVGDSVGTVSVQTESENVYSFTMPADNVKVSAIFMSNDAYVPAGEDAENLGGGDYSDISDPIPIPSVPTISASNIGMVTLFRPSLQNIMDLGNYLYTQWWNLEDNFKKWLSNPIEAMIGFNIVPCTPAVGTERVVKLGIVSSGVSMPPVNSQWYDFDCGTIDIKPYTGTMLDYAPNTKIQIMLPFIGSSALDTDEVMNRTLGLTYRIDLLSGACVAMLTINGDVRYQWTGECAVNIPFSASDFSRVYGAVLGAVGAGVTGFMAAGAAGVAAQAGAQAATTQAMNNNIAASKAFKEAIGDVVKGSRGAPALRQQLKEASSNAMQKAMAEAGSSNNIAGSIKAAQIARTVNNVVGQVMSAKGGVAHSGTISGAAGMLGVRTPYVIIEYPNQSLPENYRHFVGYPSNITAKLGDLKGYTECEQLIANGIKGTDSEYMELVEALKGGVYL